jgi:chemotaxis protein histidine kinase CheA
MLDTLVASKRIKVDAESTIARLASLIPELKLEDDTMVVEPVRAVTGPAPVRETSVPAVDSVRVPTTKLDELVNLSGEAAIAQIHLANEIDALVNIRERWQRLQLQEAGSLPLHDPETASRAGLVTQLLELGTTLEETSRRLQEAAENSGRHIESLQHRSMEIRMLPLALVLNTLPRAVRDLSRQFGKKVNFKVEGEQTTIDKRILEQIGDPLVHLLRNALDHGIETPKARGKSGKGETGTIKLGARQEGGKVLITLEDDGQGIDPLRLQEAAIAKGLVEEHEVADWTEAQLLDLIFLPGFSTSGMVTDVSGRGVGLDVVRANVERLKGQVEVTSELGKWTTFTISLPLSLATVHALMCSVLAKSSPFPLFRWLKLFKFPLRKSNLSKGVKRQYTRKKSYQCEVLLPLWDGANGMAVRS